MITSSEKKQQLISPLLFYLGITPTLKLYYLRGTAMLNPTRKVQKHFTQHRSLAFYLEKRELTIIYGNATNLPPSTNCSAKVSLSFSKTFLTFP